MATKSKTNFENKLYKIRRLSDGYFSCGKSTPKFTPNGRFFKRGPLLTHLSYLAKNVIKSRSFGGRPPITHIPVIRLLTQYANCEIIEYEIKQLETSSISLQEYMFEKLL